MSVLSHDERLAQWLEQAEARWRHLPAGEERELRVRRTFDKIRLEAERVSVRLPQLSRERLVEILEEAHVQAAQWCGVPLSDAAEALYDARLDDLFERLCLLERERLAPPAVRANLHKRRVALRWDLIRQWRAEHPDMPVTDFAAQVIAEGS